MAKTFECSGATFSIDGCISGQDPLPFYDSLAQIALRPSLREGTVLCYWKQNLEGLLAQIQSQLGADNRVVKTNPYYWTEYCSEETITTFVKKSTDAVPAPGAEVTVTIADRSHSQNGKFSKPRAGYRAYIKQLNLQAVNITAVTKSVSGAHTMTLAPINGEVLDLTKYDTYELIVDTLRIYKKGDTECITKSGLISNPPILRQGYVQKYEDGICEHEDAIDGYAFDVEFAVVKGISPITGKAINMWCAPQITEQLQSKVIDGRNINTLINQRDDVRQEGFDGLITVARQQGAFSAGYDPSSGVSLKQILLTMIKLLRKTNGCKDYMLLHDFQFGMDWADAMAELIKATGQGHIYSLFGSGGTGVRDFQYYDFGDFAAFNYHFRKFQIDLFDAIRYGAMLPDFALLLPACKFKDTNGNVVPPVTYTTIENCEPAKVKNMWVDDTRTRGCRTVDFYVKDAYGMEIHCASKLGIFEKKVC
jgi:hypothetical protein